MSSTPEHWTRCCRPQSAHLGMGLRVPVLLTWAGGRGFDLSVILAPDSQSRQEKSHGRGRGRGDTPLGVLDVCLQAARWRGSAGQKGVRVDRGGRESLMCAARPDHADTGSSPRTRWGFSGAGAMVPPAPQSQQAACPEAPGPEDGPPARRSTPDPAPTQAGPGSPASASWVCEMGPRMNGGWGQAARPQRWGSLSAEPTAPAPEPSRGQGLEGAHAAVWARGRQASPCSAPLGLPGAPAHTQLFNFALARNNRVLCICYRCGEIGPPRAAPHIHSPHKALQCRHPFSGSNK